MDDRGIVIFMVDEKMSPAVGKQLLKVRRPQQAACFLTLVLSALINELPEEDQTYVEGSGLRVAPFTRVNATHGDQPVVLQGSADPLNSAFHLTYNMVLNLLRVEEINPEYMLEKSFYQFQHYRALPGVVESESPHSPPLSRIFL